MSISEIDLVTVNITGREFKIKCPKNKIVELQKAAKYLNKKMQEIQSGDKFTTIDRVAITAALNIAHELLLEKQHPKTDSSNHNIFNKQVSDLKQKLDQALVNEI